MAMWAGPWSSGRRPCPAAHRASPNRHPGGGWPGSRATTSTGSTRSSGWPTRESSTPGARTRSSASRCRQFVEDAWISAPTMTLSELGHSRISALGPVTEIVRDLPGRVRAGPQHLGVPGGDVRASGGGSVDLSGVETFLGPLLGGQLSQPWLVLPALRHHRRRARRLAGPASSRRTGAGGRRQHRASAHPSGVPQRRRRHRWMVAGGVALVALLAVAAILGAARPVQRSRSWTRRQPRHRPVPRRLRLDDRRRRAVVSTFLRLAEGFRGERISMVIFNSSAVPVFPLTDDYDFVSDQLRRAQRSLTIVDGKDPFFAGTLNGAGSSLIGDGLATCVRSFDHPELQRAWSVILASDNEAAGRSPSRCPRAASWPDRRHPALRDEPVRQPLVERPSRCARSSSPPAGSTSLSTT